MEWAIVFYAIFMTSDGIKEDISWGLTFFHHEQCEAFFHDNKLDIVRGLSEYSTRTYEQPILKELGCAHAVANFDGTNEPYVSLKMPLYKEEQL